MKKLYIINISFIWLALFVFNFSYACKISRQLRFNLFSQDESIASGAIHSNGKIIMLDIKMKYGNSFRLWNLDSDSMYPLMHHSISCKEIKFSQNNKYVGFYFGNSLYINELTDKGLCHKFITEQADYLINGFDISEDFQIAAYYDSINRIFVYNLNNTEQPLCIFNESNDIRSIRFIILRTGSLSIIIETLYTVKFYDISNQTLQKMHMIVEKDEEEVQPRPFYGVCIKDKSYSAFTTKAFDGNFYTEIHIRTNQRDQINMRHKYCKINCPQYTGTPDVILFSGTCLGGNGEQEEVSLFSISRMKQIKIRFLNKVNSRYSIWSWGILPTGIQDWTPSLINFKLLNAQFTDNNQLVIFFEKKRAYCPAETYVIFIDIDLDSYITDFTLTYDEFKNTFYLQQD